MVDNLRFRLCAALLAFGFAAGIAAIPAVSSAATAPQATVWHFDPLPKGAAEPAGSSSPGVVNPGFVRSVWKGISGEHLGTVAKRVACIGNGVAGHRVEVLYANPSDYTNRFSTFEDPIKILAANVNREVFASAGETSGNRQIRMVTKSDCVPIVRNVQLGVSSTSTDFNDIAADLEGQGYNRTDRIYLVYFDGDVSSGGTPACGVSGQRTATFSLVADSCWSDVDDHELAHSLGAVFSIAPHASGDGHCTDNWDVLCFSGFFTPTVVTYPCDWWHHDLLDCGHDDYFNTNPAAGSFLKKHPEANTANSPYLFSTAPPINDRFADATQVIVGIVWGSNVSATIEPGEPSTAGSPPAHSIWFKIKTEAGKALTVETYGSSVDTVLGIYKGTALGSLTQVAQNNNAVSGVTYSRASVASTEATTYRIRVDGKNGAVGAIRLNVLYGNAMPKIASFSPGSPLHPVEVTLSGTNLLGDFGPEGTLPSFNGNGYQSADSGNTEYKITPRQYVVPGPISLFTGTGTVETDAPWKLRPFIASFTPTAAPPGTFIDVHGTGLASQIAPTFRIGSKSAPLDSLFTDADGYVARIKVPTGAVDAKIFVTTSTGTSSSADTFDVQ